MSRKLVIIGGGAAGFFAAINAAALYPDLEVIILEKSQQLLAKVKVSGGGRCNVTHACFEPRELIRSYPRGGKELLGPFHTFQPADMFEWLEQREVPLKTEEDGRVFPISNSSQSIINCFLAEAEKHKVTILMGTAVKSLRAEDNLWHIQISESQTIVANSIIVATGSGGSMLAFLRNLGHVIIEPVPSLFTFNCKDRRLLDLAGVSAAQCDVKIEGTKYAASGPILITHWGLSGPGILKLSAWAARELASVNYDFIVRINWDTRFSKETCLEYLKEWKAEHSRQQVKAFSAVKIPHRLWCSLLADFPAVLEMKWSDVSNKQLEQIAEAVCAGYFRIAGKSIYKEEFVTAGGVSLKEIDFKTMRSKLFSGLYFAGEVMDVDAITGGYNFQAAWTTAVIAARSAGA